MRALVFNEFDGPLTISSVADPKPPPDGVVIQVKASGICRSDWHGWQGHDPDVRLPHVPGHEFAGIVAEVGGKVRRWKPGDRLTVPFAVGCGTCPQCASGHSHICDNYYQPGFTAWGCFAEFVAVPHADGNLVRLPETLGFVESASLGCRFTTSFHALITQGHLSTGEWVAVHGCGGVGLAAIMIAAAFEAKIVAVDIRPEALDCARKLGAEQVLNAAKEPKVPETIRELTGGGAHLSIDALGSAGTCHNSVECLRKRGRHVQVGLMVGDERNSRVPMDRVIARELEIYGSHGMPAHEYGAVFDLITAGKLHPGRLVAKTVTLEQAPEELRAMTSFANLGATVINRF